MFSNEQNRGVRLIILQKQHQQTPHNLRKEESKIRKDFY